MMVSELQVSLRKKCPNVEFFSGPYFPVFSPNAGKYGPEKTPYLDTFHESLGILIHVMQVTILMSISLWFNVFPKTLQVQTNTSHGESQFTH